VKLHHAAIVTTDIDAGLRFWRDGLGFEVQMDTSFEGDWPALFDAPSDRLRSVFLGDPASPDAGVVELVDFGDVPSGPVVGAPTTGFFLLSVYCAVDEVLARLADLGLGGQPRRIESYGVTMVVVTDPAGVRVELIDLA
jgi:glyoxylase I family protein